MSSCQPDQAARADTDGRPSADHQQMMPLTKANLAAAQKQEPEKQAEIAGNDKWEWSEWVYLLKRAPARTMRDIINADV